MTSPSPERNGSPMISPRGETIAVKQPPEMKSMGRRVLPDLFPLLCLEPPGGVDDEAAGFQGVIADADLDLLCEEVPGERAGPHGRVDLFSVGHHRVPRERVVVLPACQLADTPDRAVYGAKARAVTLPPDHALGVRREFLRRRCIKVPSASKSNCVL